MLSSVNCVCLSINELFRSFSGRWNRIQIRWVLPYFHISGVLRFSTVLAASSFTANKEVGIEINVEKIKYVFCLVTRMQVKIRT
jgi:hypothetical protein